jgi:P-type Ca2+ transporter type 2C
MKPLDVVRELSSSVTDGLRSEEAKGRLEKYGPNKLAVAKKTTVMHMVLEQLFELMVIILIISGFIALFVGETIDASIIFFVVIINTIVGVLQEYKAEKALDALKKMMSAHATVVRDRDEKIIPIEEIVPGDIIILEEGSKVPADARILESAMLKVDEAVLTGESVPRLKNETVIASKTVPLADRKNMLFMGTIVNNGRCKAIVVETGMRTEFGKIAGLTAEIKEEKSPLQKELVRVGKFIAALIFTICGLVLISGILTGRHFSDMLIFVVSLGVAAVPESLPAIMTVALAIGVQKMARRKAIVRKLSSVETIGSTTVICTDKTGTLTKNQMTVRKIYLGDKFISVDGEGYDPTGRFLYRNNSYSDNSLTSILRTGLVCNNAFLRSEAGKWEVVGDPTEGALIVAAEKNGLKQDAENERYKRIHEVPFSSKTRLMVTVNRDASGKKIIAYMKGSPEAVLEACGYVEKNGKAKRISKKDLAAIKKADDQMASEALRVLGFAYKVLDPKDLKKLSKLKLTGFTFQGLQGMIDPPRLEVKDAVARCKDAGIRIYVVTGDQGITAKAVAKEVGIATESTRVVTGPEVDSLPDDKLIELLSSDVLFARVTAENKMRIVSLLMSSNKEVVAVTGDGVNDAPALKRANIGVAMGITGTDVSKEASKIILTDDSFATIVNAIEEGRTVYSNINKFIRYMFSSNLGEILAIFIGMFLILPNLPPQYSFITAAQILWSNLGTDVLPALALALEPAEAGVMKKKPRNTRDHILTTRHFVDWMIIGFILATCIVSIFIMNMDDPLKAGTMAFSVMIIGELMHVLNCKDEKKSIFSKEFFSNKMLLGAILISVLMQVAVVYTPWMQEIFNTVPLSIYDWLVVLGFSFVIVIYEEGRKWIERRNK